MPDEMRLHNRPPEPVTDWPEIDLISDPAPPSKADREQWLAAFSNAVFLRYQETLARYAELEAGCARVPAIIDSASDAARVVDFVSQVELHLKAGYTAHRAEKALFQQATRIIDVMFFGPGTALAEALEPVREKLLAYYQQLPRAPGRRPQIRGDYGAVAYAKTSAVFEVEDIDQVPREYLMLNPQAVREAIEKRGEREIPGLRIEAREQLIVKQGRG